MGRSIQGFPVVEKAAFLQSHYPDQPDGSEQRSAKRYSLLIRPAKLVSSQGEFVCVLRDVSRSGVSARLFHDLPRGDNFQLELQNRHSYPIKRVWVREQEAGFEFEGEVNVDQLISEASEFPKRGLRLALEFPVTIITGTVRIEAMVKNISQQGARIECRELLAIDQNLRLESASLRETRTKVRWRDGTEYGLVFDDTFSLRDFALLMARLQAPGLLA